MVFLLSHTLIRLVLQSVKLGLLVKENTKASQFPALVLTYDLTLKYLVKIVRITESG